MNNRLQAPEQSEALVAVLQWLKRQQYEFTTITPASHSLVNQRPGNETARDITGILGWSRLFTAEIAGRELFDLLQQANVLSAEGGLWRCSLRVSSLAGHLFLHSAFPTTDGDTVFFGPDTYRFANAISQYLALHKPHVQRAVDIGTGSGAAATLLAQEFPGAQVYGVDINEQSLKLAHVNGVASGLTNLHWRFSNLLNDLEGEFGLIVANPPYLVDDSARIYRHGGGLLGAELSLKIVEAAMQRLAPNGVLLLYTGVAIVDGRDLFLSAIKTLSNIGNMQYEYREIDPDIFGEELQNPAYVDADRLAAVVLTLRKL
ncbi:class I SAM-dependent methyltransferase [Methylobacillus arboreus]|uniref:methyltransferase n=1 Tax=Methylobacillus arboreus TaxID=755170 RepID=UPI001E60F759|nr:class I SAM-dependent methyltransferase [Methylobacillus arboreus]MCB5191859.1 class I SAM-dependent methyltransferase [Methylobacillus arboreus]